VKKKHHLGLPKGALGTGEEADNPAVPVKKLGSKLTNGHSHNAHPLKMNRGSAMHVPPIKHDKLIHPSHNEMNAAHDMHDGYAPDDGYEPSEDAGEEGNETHD
jgi:hypothetical protein